MFESGALALDHWRQSVDGLSGALPLGHRDAVR
jgi:hypothetical protein